MKVLGELLVFGVEGVDGILLVIESNLELVVLLPEILIFFSEVPVGLFKVANSEFSPFDLPFQRQDLLIFLAGQFLQDSQFPPTLFDLVLIPAHLDCFMIQIYWWQLLLDLSPYAPEKILEGLVYFFVGVFKRVKLARRIHCTNRVTVCELDTIDKSAEELMILLYLEVKIAQLGFSTA